MLAIQCTPLDIDILGCTPTPLASYLKAVGILRLISSPGNQLDNIAVDPAARGWWQNEHFCLKTVLNDSELVRFFLETYVPTPIIAPWNGGSGFYPKDNTYGFDPLVPSSNKKISGRFRSFSTTIQIAQKIIKRHEAAEGPGIYNNAEKEKKWKPIKWKIIQDMRNELPDAALGWIDSVLVTSGNEPLYSSLLGTGGNDGRLDFTNNFMRQLVSEHRTDTSVFNAASGEPTAHAKPLLRSALFASSTESLGSSKIGQFFPGAQTVNPWDYILMLEGAIAFAGSAARRHHSKRQRIASFPFTVDMVGAGWGGLTFSDESAARAEFWAPLWGKPAKFLELIGFLAEGRAIQGAVEVSNGLDFARAAGSLGVSRGLSEFQRYGFLQRAGKAYHATPIGRHLTNFSPATTLLTDLDAHGWLASVKNFGRHSATSASARLAVKQFEDAMFNLVGESNSQAGAEQTLIALGRVCNWLANSPKGREVVQPPPLLSSAWIEQANDNSAEFRIAAALASIGVPWHDTNNTLSIEATVNSDDAAANDGTVADTGGRFESKNIPERHHDVRPMVVHFAPLNESTICYKQRTWSATGMSPSKVWGCGNLILNMMAVLERRLIEMTVHDLNDKPLSGAIYASLFDMEAFLSGNFDDIRCAALLSGLIWVNPQRLTSVAYQEKPFVPFAYAALKPLFTANAVLDSAIRNLAIDATIRIPIPPGLVARLRAGGSNLNGHATDQEVRNALMRARRSGLASCFDSVYPDTHRTVHARGQIGAGCRPDRLAASLLIPIGSRALEHLLKRSYRINMNKETNHAI